MSYSDDDDVLTGCRECGFAVYEICEECGQCRSCCAGVDDLYQCPQFQHRQDCEMSAQLLRHDPFWRYAEVNQIVAMPLVGYLDS